MTTRTNPWKPALVSLLLALPLGGACGGTEPASDNGTTFPGGGGAPGHFDGGVGPGGPGGSAPPLPPEVEVESSYEVPVATGRFVWIANPQSGRVAFVDAATLIVRTVEAGNGPTFLAAVPGPADAVVVLNVLSHDASYLRAEGDGTRLTSVMIPSIAPRANAWAVSQNGRWALAWTDARRALEEAADAGTNRLDGFQDVTAIDLSTNPPVATTVAVGFRPVSISFDVQGQHAYAVTQDGVSVIGLPGPSGAVEVLRDVPLGASATENTDTRDVSITPDGRAVVRREGSADIRIVDLATGSAAVVTLGGPVTDVDITADGSQAVAVVRQTGEIAILQLATAVADPTTGVRRVTIDGEVVGSVALTADGKQAILYSNATDAERLTVLDLATAGHRVLRVHAPVLSVHATPDGRHAVVVHRIGAPAPTTATTTTTAAAVDGGGASDAGAGAAARDAGVPAADGIGAFSVIPLDGSRSGRIQETEAPPQAVAFSAGSTRALVPVRNDRKKIYAAYVVTLPSLQVERIALGSPPIATGVVAGADRGFVAQRHPEGRITFIPLSGGSPRTLTGFDLGARIVAGETP